MIYSGIGTVGLLKVLHRHHVLGIFGGVCSVGSELHGSSISHPLTLLGGEYLFYT